MKFCIMASPGLGMTGVVIDDDGESKYRSTFFYDSLLREVKWAIDAYDIDEIIVIGSKNYTEKLQKDIQQEYVNIPVTLED